VGIIWAFFISASCSATLTIVRLLSPTEEEGGSDPSFLQLLATFYLYYASFRLMGRFGQTAALIGWESLEDFPMARRIMVKSTHLWPSFSILLFSSLGLSGLLLFLLPSLCSHK